MWELKFNFFVDRFSPEKLFQFKNKWQLQISVLIEYMQSMKRTKKGISFLYWNFVFIF